MYECVENIGAELKSLSGDCHQGESPEDRNCWKKYQSLEKQVEVVQELGDVDQLHSVSIAHPPTC